MKRSTKLTREQIISLMAKMQFFSSLTGSERANIAEYAVVYLADAEEAIIEKDAMDTCCYALLNGTVKVLLDRKGDIVARMKPGQLFGEIGFILHAPRTSWILAETDCALLRIDQLLINSMDKVTREKLKDQIIIKMAKTIQSFNDASLG